MEKIKKIGLVGYFNVGAYADDLIMHVTKQLLQDNSDERIVFDDDLHRKTPSIKLLDSFDLIVLCGGSWLGECILPPINRIGSWYDKTKTPFVIFGAGYGYKPQLEPLIGESKSRMKILFENAKFISLRGGQSLLHCEENGIDISEVGSLGDPVFASEVITKHGPTGVIGGNVRNLHAKETQHSTNENNHKLFAEIYDWLIEKTNKKINLISFRHNYPGWDNDLEGATKVINLMEYKDAVFNSYYANIFETFYYVNKCDFWFGQRLHPCILSAGLGKPFVGLEYQFNKMIDCMSTIECKDYIKVPGATLETFKEKYETSMKNVIRKEKIDNIKKEIKSAARKIVECVK